MNVSFLSSTGTFNGVEYNMKKLGLNAADLVYTQNMEALSVLGMVSTKDYVEYLQAWSDRNPRVRNRQFHVAISERGREKTMEELLEISKVWLSKMGYSDVPAMFFFHRDTDNNHIHIVAPRINADGKKIDDSHEIRRGLSAMRELVGVELKDKAKVDFETFENYRFSSLSQYSKIWESRGYKTFSRDGVVKVFKEGHHVLTRGDDDIKKRVSEDYLSRERATEIRSLLGEYKNMMTREELALYLKEEHQLDLLFYGKGNNPYAYTIVDHRDRAVYKGSDVLPIKELLSDSRVFTDEEQVERVNLFALSRLDSGRFTSKELRDTIKKWGLFIKGDQIIHRKAPIGEIDPKIIADLRYNDSLSRAEQVYYRDEASKKAVAKYFGVSVDDFEYKGSGVFAEQRDLQALYEAAQASGDLYAYLKEEQVGLVYSEGKLYLMDKESGYSEEVDTPSMEQSYYSKPIHIKPSDTLNEMLGLNAFEYVVVTKGEDNPRKKKRR